VVPSGPAPVITTFSGRAHCSPGQSVGEATLTWHSERGEQAWLLYLGGAASSAVTDPLARPGSIGPLAASGTAVAAVDCSKPAGFFLLGVYRSTLSATRVLTIPLP
jgi:hypothetical protein